MAGTRLAGNGYTYTGRRLDRDTGLYYYRARYYHSRLGQFLSRDFIPAKNLYEYANSRPVAGTDPFGLLYWEGPEAAIVSFIDAFTPTTALFWELQDAAGDAGVDGLSVGDYARIMVMLGQLAESANPRPANTYANWNTLLATKEYRGFMRAQAQIECSCNQITAHRKDWKTDAGWTPIRPLGDYERGEGESEADVSYAGSINSSVWQGSPANKACIGITFKHQFRIGWVGQLISELAFGVAVPWAWGDIEYRMCCNGQYKILYGGSHFPSHYAYLNKTKVGQQMQSDLGGFIFNTPGARAAGSNFHTETGSAIAKPTWTITNSGP